MKRRLFVLSLGVGQIAIAMILGQRQSFANEHNYLPVQNKKDCSKGNIFGETELMTEKQIANYHASATPPFKYWCNFDKLDEACRAENTDTPLYDPRLKSCANNRTCFLTTACADFVGLSDNCFELKSLRGFRDSYLARQSGGLDEIEAYYELAYLIMPAITQLDIQTRSRLLSFIYARYILPCAVLSRLGFNKLTHLMYRSMVNRLVGELLYSRATVNYGVAVTLHSITALKF